MPIDRPFFIPPFTARGIGDALCGTLVTACLLVAPGLAGCGEAARAQTGASPGPVVGVVPAIIRRVNDSETFSGRLEAIDLVELRPRITGTIDKVHFGDGATVKKGDLLFTVDPLPFRAELARSESQLAGARARHELADKQLARATSLLASQAASQEEVDQQSSASRSSQSDIRAAEAAITIAQLNLGYTLVRAPIGGHVSKANVTAGNLVNEQSVLTTIAGVDRVYAYFDASEATFLALQTGEAAREAPRVRMNLLNEQSYPHAGRLDFIDNRVNPLTGAIRMRASFDNKKGDLTPGLSAKIRMESRLAYDAVMVPERAIGTDQSKKYVFVVDKDGMPRSRTVEPGALFGAMRALREGVQAGEMVVVDGLQRVRPGQAVQATVLNLDAQGASVPAAASAPASKT